MIYILCVVHVTYWLGTFGQPISSLILFEMPVIFFISGAAISLGGKHRGLLPTLANRAMRVLAPYYVLAALCSIAFLVFSLVRGHDILQKHTAVVIFKALWPTDGALPVPYTRHLWFVTPYLIVCCIFCFYQKLADRSNRYVFLIAFLSLCAFVQMLTDNMLIRNVVFYSFFYAAGYLCYNKMTVNQMTLVGICSLSVVALLYVFGWKGSMQLHKFPPDMLFLCYGITSLCILGIILNYITIPQNRLLRIWNTNGYTIYLWQNVTFAIFTYGTAIFMENSAKLLPVIDFVFKALSIFIIATVLSFVVVPFERNVIRRIGRKVS